MLNDPSSIEFPIDDARCIFLSPGSRELLYVMLDIESGGGCVFLNRETGKAIKAALPIISVHRFDDVKVAMVRARLHQEGNFATVTAIVNLRARDRLRHERMEGQRLDARP